MTDMITARMMFLSASDIADLTGIRTGKDGRTREQRQVAALKQMRIKHWVNAAGLPVVATATIEGGTAPQEQRTWEPA